jgi:uncharacterized protein (DUF488 family)
LAKGKGEKEMSLHALYTLGYTGLKPEQLKTVAEKLGAVVADIRLAPRSRVPHWNYGNLNELLKPNYVWVRQWGNVNYKRGGEIKLYEPIDGATVIMNLLLKSKVILLCACKDYRTCHRSVAANLLASETRIMHMELNDVLELCK